MELKKKVTAKNIIGVARALVILRVNGVKVGSLPRIRGRCYIKNQGDIIIGNNFSVTSYPIPVSIDVQEGAKLSLGENVFLNYGVDLGCSCNIRMGNNVKIGPLTNIIDSNYHLTDASDSSGPKAIEIGDNVWIGRQVIILPGVRVGSNSVIAAGSVVRQDVPSNTLCAGSPARIIRELDIPAGWVRT